MTLDSSFGAAYVDNGTRHRLLGVRVKPFCLWHLLLLQILDSPFLRAGKASAFDLKTAVAVCRLGYRQSKLRRPIYPIITEKRLKYHCDRFHDFVGDYLSKPEYNIISIERFDGKPSTPLPRVNSAPSAVATAFEAAWGSNCSMKEAWEMPIGEAYIAQSMHFKHQGALVDYMLDDEKKFQQELMAAGVK